MKKPKALTAVVSSELVRQMSEALQPFASEFKRRMAKSGMNSKSRREWNERMPDGFPITLKVTMGDCRRAVAALPNDKISRQEWPAGRPDSESGCKGHS